VALVYASLFVTWIVIGRILNTLMAGDSPELILEIPPYRVPPARALAFKLWMRMRSYFVDAVPYVMLGVLVVNVLHFFRVFDFLADAAAPVFTRLLGLPKEAVLAVLVGFFRKDVAVGMLSSLHLTAPQLVVSVTVLAMSFPCVATFVILGKELGMRGLVKSFGIMVAASIVVGATLARIL
jgi:ferrous iron transport protein B